jgi:hypothetical protein
VEKLQAEQLRKRDMVVPSSCMSFQNGMLRIVSRNSGLSEVLKQAGVVIKSDDATISEFTGTEPFHRQLAATFDIPYNYYRRMQAPANIDLLDENVSHWFSKQDKNYLIRCFESVNPDESGIVRAILGDRYRILDNLDVLMATLEAVRVSGVNLQIESGDISDTKMYLRFVAPDIIKESPDLLSHYRVPNRSGSGDTGIIAGFVLTNSETGHGSSFVAPRLVVNACKNGMIMKKDAMSKVHLGGRMQEGGIEWSRNTMSKNIELVIEQVKDAVKLFTDPQYLGKAIAELEAAGGKKVERPVDTIQNLSNELMFTQDQQNKLLSYFMESGDYTGFGVAQAMTYFAHQDATPDQRFELEAASVEILTTIDQYDRPATAPRRGKNK